MARPSSWAATNGQTSETEGSTEPYVVSKARLRVSVDAVSLNRSGVERGGGGSRCYGQSQTTVRARAGGPS